MTEVTCGVMFCGGHLPSTGFSSPPLADPVRGCRPAEESVVTHGCRSCLSAGAYGDDKCVDDNPAKICSFWGGVTKL